MLLGGAAGFVPQRFIEIFQFFKTETAHQAGCAAGGNPSRFDGDGAAAAKWVLKRLAAVVTRQQQQACRQIFAQRRFAGVLAVAAFKQGFAAGIDENLHRFVVDKRMHAHVGVKLAHARARAAGIAESVAQRIFDFQADKIEAFHLRAFAFHFHLEGLFQRKPCAPFDVAGELVDVVFVAVAAFGELQQHAAGAARMQVDAVHLLQRAFAGRAAIGRLNLRAALRLQFGR